MDLKHDRKHGIAYLRLLETPEGVAVASRCVRHNDVGPEIVLDFLPDGRLAGIEFLSANKQFPRSQRAETAAIKAMEKKRKKK